MSIRTRILLGILTVVGLGLGFLIWWMSSELKPNLRLATEEPLVDAARLMASLVAAGSRSGSLDLEPLRQAVSRMGTRPLEAAIYDFVKTSSDLRVYVTDARGVVLFDSRDGRSVGKSYAERLDVGRTLKGRYGARTSHDIPDDPETSVMYVAAPIDVEGRLVGVLTLGKPTSNVNRFVRQGKRRIGAAAAATGGAVILVGLVISGMVIRPVRRLTEYARAIRDGHEPPLPDLATVEIRELGLAFEEMREALEGKRTVERYVRSLTHEIKGPLSAIQGAAELLTEEMPPEQRRRFVSNIVGETARATGLVDRLLLLSSLEARKGVERPEPVDLLELAGTVRSGFGSVIETRRLEVTLAGEPGTLVQGERLLLQHAVSNLLQNALEFSPPGGKVRLEVTRERGRALLAVVDSGPGIPDYALARVFERFYSLERPDTGKKSSGLGLSLVREIASMHGGTAALSNEPGGGARATLELPAVGEP
ncbi:MAG: two-component system sensor histidine kinase CreC [Candidatus Riflebacteria bacterium]|nr:two-component system sensor histidine kinase CreC [Candidatus Riflebacteria bacterium]